MLPAAGYWTNLLCCGEYICFKLQGGLAAKQQMKALRAQKAAAVAAQAKQAEEQRAAAAEEVMTAPCNLDAFSLNACCYWKALRCS